MGRRRGWELAQLRTSFLSDPEFQRLARAAPDDRDFLAAVGLWAIGLAAAWREDDPEVDDALSAYDVPDIRALLERDLVADGSLRGFASWTAEVREKRQADADRKKKGRQPASPRVRRSPKESGGVRRSHTESSVGVGVGEVVGESMENVGPLTLAPREEPRPSRQRAEVRGFTRPFGAAAR